jgi:hypothetical protein
MAVLALGRRRRLGAAASAAFVAALLGPLGALADAAPPWHPGDAVGEPTGAVARVAITHEDLDFDLRPLADGAPVRVRATYQLRNDADETNAALVFLADHALTGGASFAVTFDGAAVRATPTTLTVLPSAWKPPTSTPTLIDEAKIPYNTTPGTAFQFTVVIPSGQHRLSVDYALLAGQFSFPGQTTVWQVAYVLAPARQWESFADLSVQAQLPTGWRARSLPGLLRQGDSLQGHFDGLPADSMAISASYPVDAHVQGITEWLLGEWLFFLVLGTVTIACALLWIRKASDGWIWAPAGLGWSIPAAAEWLRTGYLTPPATQYVGGKCGFVAAGCLLLPGALIIVAVAAGLGLLAMCIAILVAALVWRRARR